MDFQLKLQALRKEKGLSQENLAEHIGVSRQAVAKWEAGQSYPDICNLIAISDLFKISIDKLVKEYDKDGCFFEEKRDENKIDDEIISFLCRAKKATYAANGAGIPSSRPGSHDLQYIEEDLQYIDTYLGGEKFAGEEALWKDNIPFWSMNYTGRILSEEFSGDFLKEALLKVDNEYPYRGPLVYQNGEYKYHLIINGKFDWFQGYEEIFFNNKKVYECIFNGGFIK